MINGTAILRICKENAGYKHEKYYVKQKKSRNKIETFLFFDYFEFNFGNCHPGLRW